MRHDLKLGFKSSNKENKDLVTVSSSDEHSETKSDHKVFKRPSRKNPKGYVSIDMGENSMD